MPDLATPPTSPNSNSCLFPDNGVDRTRSRRSRNGWLPDPLQCSTQSAIPSEPPPSEGDNPYRLINPEWMGRYAPSPASSDAIKFRHSFWSTPRERVRKAMVDAGFPLARRYGFQVCGGSGMVWVDKSRGVAKVTSYCCHDRWCQACGRAKRQRLAKALTTALPGHRAVHIVLTPQSNDRPLRDQAKKLIADFARLRRRKWWQARAAGGAWVFELTWNSETSQWHPHLHTLVHASWMQLQELSAEWHSVTKTSHRVHISLVHQHESAIREMSKYVGELMHRSWEHDHTLVVCAMKALQGIRLAGTFGTWRGVQLDAAAEPDPAAVWECWGSLDRLYELAKSRDPEALAIFAQLHGKTQRLELQPSRDRAPPTPTQAEPS